ncbi:EF-hand domain-containing protein [Sphingomonas psychrotolerans]|uniref:EF-hand domain-containing protein n=1 Tax=Sphingomonas psychrotolerans TaxID=1327635 RepID=A0ABU3N0S4_9SPHN|nr:EF-hand domain-containing protein [Sphingomonas psychrotolerans]MDT8757826.1 EF-hand domain-containing protein [Sphingomonas psychrotolerans]
MKKIFAAALLATTLLAGSATAAPQDRPMRGDMLAKADANGDGIVTKAEFLADVDARFAKHDANKDGKISKDERPGHGEGRGGRMMHRIDTDNDGAISLDEQRAAAARRFDRLDANSDGKVDQAERDASRERMRRMMERRAGNDADAN